MHTWASNQPAPVKDKKQGKPVGAPGVATVSARYDSSLTVSVRRSSELTPARSREVGQPALRTGQETENGMA